MQTLLNLCRAYDTTALLRTLLDVCREHDTRALLQTLLAVCYGVSCCVQYANNANVCGLPADMNFCPL